MSGQNIEIVKLQIRRGLESQLPILDQGEPAITTDTNKIFVGDGATNHELAHKTDLDATNVQLADIAKTNANVEVSNSHFANDGTVYDSLSTRLDAMIDIPTVNNHSITYGYDSNGNVQTVTEKDNSNNTIKTVTYTYNTSGDVSQSVAVMNGKTVTTTYNYDSTTGNITSTSNVIS